MMKDWGQSTWLRDLQPNSCHRHPQVLPHAPALHTSSPLACTAQAPSHAGVASAAAPATEGAGPPLLLLLCRKRAVGQQGRRGAQVLQLARRQQRGQGKATACDSGPLLLLGYLQGLMLGRGHNEAWAVLLSTLRRDLGVARVVCLHMAGARSACLLLQFATCVAAGVHETCRCSLA